MAKLKPRKMIADVRLVKADERVTIAVTHEDYQSYSHAVRPRADREFREVAKRFSLSGEWSSHWGSYEGLPDEVAEDGRCVSLVIYERRAPKVY